MFRMLILESNEGLTTSNRDLNNLREIRRNSKEIEWIKRNSESGDTWIQEFKQRLQYVTSNVKIPRQSCQFTVLI